MSNQQDCVDLGLFCADVCKSLDRGLKGRRLDELSQSVLEGIQQLTTCVRPSVHTLSDSVNLFFNRRTVAEIETKIVKQGGRNPVLRLFNAKNDKEKIAGWMLSLNRILQIFNVCLVSRC